MGFGRSTLVLATAVLCTAGGLAVSGPSVFAQTTTVAKTSPASPQPSVGAAGPATPTRSAPLPAPKPEASWPKVLPDPKAAHAPAAPVGWSPQEIEIAKARCNAILKTLDAVVLPVDPIRESGDCGTPAPVQLVSIGKNPQVAMSPPAIVTCDVVAGLHKWLQSDLQPLARKHLGSPIIKLEIMSSYSCRNAYGRTKTRLSEHGRANALDIRGFMTANAQPVELLADWGPTQREIATQVAAAKAAAAKEEAERAAAAARNAPQQPGQGPAAVAQQPPTLPGGTGTIIDGLPRVRVTIPGVSGQQGSNGTALGLTPPSRLGGPKVKGARTDTAATPPQHLPQAAQHVQDKKSQFLRQAHVGGCRIFGTILGPEANNAHRNHFHVDMAERATNNFCE